jgi:hypothetical protein
VSDVLKALAVTAELTGTELSRNALLAMEADLSTYPVESVCAALTRCRRELPGRLTLAAIIERLNGADGRPTANEAWAIALLGFDEAETIVTNEEIVAAMATARPIFRSGDEVGARMAFRDAYERNVEQARATGRAPAWYPSLGTDSNRREAAIHEAVERGRIDPAKVAGLLPIAVSGDGHGIMALLEGKPLPSEISPAALERLKACREILSKKSPSPGRRGDR